jgi:hypothetical protein
LQTGMVVSGNVLSFGEPVVQPHQSGPLLVPF